MGERGMIDATKPWHILFRRNGRWHISETFDDLDYLVGTLTNMAEPDKVVVRHIPSNRDGSGKAFLDSFNRGEVAEMTDQFETENPAPGYERFRTVAEFAEAKYGIDPTDQTDPNYPVYVVDMNDVEKAREFLEYVVDMTTGTNVPMYRLAWKIDADGLAFKVDDEHWSRPFGERRSGH